MSTLDCTRIQGTLIQKCFLSLHFRLLEVEWLNDLWRPDSFFKNAKQVTFQTMTIPNHYVWLYKDSTILYMVK